MIRIILIKTVLCLLTSMLGIAVVNAQFTPSEPLKTIDLSQNNSRFEQLKGAIFGQPYEQLPQYKVKRRFFGSSGKSDKNKVLVAARRTFESSADLIDQPNGQKLLNANGICFSGVWQITTQNPYTGLYEKGAVSPAIVRASVALSGTKQKNKRAFGMAIKLLPNDLGESPSLNAFVLHTMGGTITKNVLGLSMDNQPPLGSLPRFSDLSTALRLRRDLERADKEFGAIKPDASYRPVNVFADYLKPGKESHSPKWLRLTPITQKRVDFNDFRNELRVENYTDNNLTYSIDVAGDHSSPDFNKKNIQWQTIGSLKLTESITSKVCDLNLHFQHPRLK